MIEDDFDPDDPGGPTRPGSSGPSRPGSSGPAFSIGGLHWMAWLFIVFAVGDLAWFVANANIPAASTLWDTVFYAFQVIPAVASVLVPAALLARHGDATTRAPVLLLGMFLFALVQGLLLLANPLQPLFETLTPASEDVPFLVPLAAFYGGLTLLIGAIGLALIARGLSLARRYEDGSASLTAPLLAVTTIFATIVGILAATRLPLPDGPIPVSYLVYLVSTILLGILRIAVWTYLTTTALGGWFAGEEPSAGWVLASVGSAVVILALVLVNLAGVLDIQDATFVAAYGWIITILYATGQLGLLVAFAIGLPGLDESDDGSDEADEDVDEDG